MSNFGPPTPRDENSAASHHMSNNMANPPSGAPYGQDDKSVSQAAATASNQVAPEEAALKQPNKRKQLIT